MAPLPSDLRNLLDKAVGNAREAAEAAARAALTALAVAEERPDFLRPLSAEDRALRVALRAKARQLANSELRGDEAVRAGLEPLAQEVAYAQWHRMLFARFLAENSLLRHPEGIAVTLADCAELADEAGEGDAWTLAARYASQMLPGIFQTSDPAARVRFAPEGNQALERILTALPVAVFTADDALGWVYQFWQTKKKKEANASGRKIGGADLAPVTQLFTEHYMVAFLLENSLGAWWAARHPDSPLLQDFTYLRFKDDGTPAAGTFPGWPERAAEVTVMDPCCGSGHFLVAAFAMLRQMRMEEEGLDEAAVADAVLRDNLFGLEIDARCTQIAAFALALAAWKAGGYRELPIPHIACSGIPVVDQWQTWEKLAGADFRLKNGLKRLYDLFSKAPDLGSLINPADQQMQTSMEVADFAEVEQLLRKALAKERTYDDPAAAVFGDAVAGVVRATDLLARKYTLVATNVPYLQSGKQTNALRDFCDSHYPDSKPDLATVFLERCRAIAAQDATYAVVTPHNWRFLRSYTRLRKKLLTTQTWNIIVNLGSKSFQTPMWEFNIGLSVISNRQPSLVHAILAIDASPARDSTGKMVALAKEPLQAVEQSSQLQNRDALISMHGVGVHAALAKYASVHYGSKPGQTSRVTRYFWEVEQLIPSKWMLMESTPDGDRLYSGKSERPFNKRAWRG